MKTKKSQSKGIINGKDDGAFEVTGDGDTGVRIFPSFWAFHRYPLQPHTRILTLEV